MSQSIHNQSRSYEVDGRIAKRLFYSQNFLRLGSRYFSILW